MQQHRPSSTFRRAVALLVDVLILILMAIVLAHSALIFYLNVAIFVYGTYERRIPDTWVELLILVPHVLVAIASGVLYFRLFGRSGGTPGQRIMSR